MNLPAIVALLNYRKSRILRMAEAALPETQFRAFRGLVLDEFGREGLERDLERLMAEREQGNGPGRPIRAKEGGAP
ncbi:MAG: hypothetical protein J0M00_07050 [Burkholderiales bacterium]|nr:hypothetical protein [Burkholderiales bacterium]